MTLKKVGPFIDSFSATQIYWIGSLPNVLYITIYIFKAGHIHIIDRGKPDRPGEIPLSDQFLTHAIDI